MSKQEWEIIRKVGDIRLGFQAMEELLGEQVIIQLSEAAQRRWHELNDQYDAFYDMDVRERLKFSGMLSEEAQNATPKP